MTLNTSRAAQARTGWRRPGPGPSNASTLDIALIRPPPPGLGSAHQQAIKLLKNITCSPQKSPCGQEKGTTNALASDFLPAVLRRQATDAWQKPHLSAQLQTPNRNGWWHLKFGAPIWGNIWSDFRIWTVPAVYHTFTSLLNTTLQRIRAFSGLQLLSPAAGLIPSLYFSQQETKPNHDSATTTTKKPLGSYGNRA